MVQGLADATSCQIVVHSSSGPDLRVAPLGIVQREIELMCVGGFHFNALVPKAELDPWGGPAPGGRLAQASTSPGIYEPRRRRAQVSTSQGDRHSWGMTVEDQPPMKKLLPITD